MAKKPVAAFLADPHISGRTPEYRREAGSFYGVTFAKLSVVADYMKKRDVPAFIAGDVFDRSRDFMDLWMMREFLASADLGSNRFFVVPGQHDRFYHDAQEKATSLNAVIKSNPGSVSFIPRDAFEIADFSVYGAGWGEEVPVPNYQNAFNILVWHRTLWHKTPVFPGQTDGNVSVEAAKLEKLGYRMVFSGDNHKAFDVRCGGVEVYNLGAFTRTSVTLKDQQPRFCVLFDDRTVESVYVGATDVFDLGRSDADKGREDVKDEFSEALLGGFDPQLSFKANLEAVSKSGVCGEVRLTETQKGMVGDVVNRI